MTAVNHPITLPGHGEISGSHPIVLVGPNGSGKTRMASELARTRSFTRIAAQRLLQIGPNVGMRTPAEYNQQLQNILQQQMTEPWRPASELDAALARLIGEHSRHATDYYDRSRATKERLETPETDLTRLSALWSELFPGRAIRLSDYQPMIEAAGGKYLAQYMSDGERVALYLVLRVLLANPGVLIVDEPEIHLHERLARRLWSTLEAQRSDVRFVYVTHSLSFALSRTNAQFGIVKSEREVKVLERSATSIPPEVFEEIVGAATFARGARRFVFCEGKNLGFDEAFYSAYYAKDAETAVIAVGGCDHVRKCVEVFKSKNVPIAGAQAIGIVDRDYWPAEYLASLPPLGVHPLPFHELESLLCAPEIFDPLAARNGKADTGDEFAGRIRAKFGVGPVRNEVILMRAKERVRVSFTNVLGALSTKDDVAVLRSQFVGAMSTTTWTPTPELVFDEETKVVENALAGSLQDLLRVLPGKNYFAERARQAGFVDSATYKSVITKALLATPADAGFKALKEALAKALAIYLPAFPS